MAAMSNKSLTLTFTISMMALFWEPCYSIAIPLRTRSQNRQHPLESDDANKIPQDWQPGQQQTGNSQEIHVYLPGAPPGSIQGPPGGMRSQDSQESQPAPVTAFSAHRLKGLSVTTGTKNITYDREELDLTNTFEHTKGYFQCQVPGLYYFSFSFWARTSTPLKVGLKQNGHTKAALFVSRGTLLDQASQSTILNLKRGDRVWLEAFAPSVITSSTSPINIFNGYLIQAITTNHR